MPINWIDTEPSVVPVVYEVPASVFEVPTGSYQVYQADGSAYLPAGAMILGVSIHKVTPFDAGDVQIGHGAVTAQRETVSTPTDTAATVAGVSTPSAWKAAGGMADALLTAQRAVHVRIPSGTLPTVGHMKIVFLLYKPSPRPAL